MALDKRQNSPGFQGSENSGVEVTFHARDGDPIVLNSGILTTEGRRRIDDDPSLINVTTSKSLGTASGTFSITMKRGRNESLFDRILDDDWVDIVFFRNGRRWHTMRGLVDEGPRRIRSVAGNGATVETFAVTGRDFGKIWEMTPVWFSAYSGENVSGAVSLKVWSSKLGAINVSDAVRGFLIGFLTEIGNTGRVNWVIPETVPNTNGNFADSVNFDDFRYADDPPRASVTANFLMPNGTLWSLAKEWSDPSFCELFVDLYPQSSEGITGLAGDGVTFSGGQGLVGFDQDDGYDVNDTVMNVILRDKPFIQVDTSLDRTGKDSPWFSLPLFTIPQQMIVSSDIGRGGLERYNAFFVSPQVIQESSSSALDLTAPLWDPADIRRHGLRRFDISSRYTSPNADILGLATKQRLQIRDWYAANYLLLNGQIQLGIGMPQIKVGTRIRIPGATGPDTDETYYVENVAHSWSLQPGVRTSLGVTRGYIGTDDEFIRNLEKIVRNYTIPFRARPAVGRTTPADVGFA